MFSLVQMRFNIKDLLYNESYVLKGTSLYNSFSSLRCVLREINDLLYVLHFP